MTELWRPIQANKGYFEEFQYQPPYRMWWSGLIALRNTPFRSDYRGITKDADVRLRQGDKEVPVMLLVDNEPAETVGRVVRIWDKDEDEIWGLLCIERVDLVKANAPLWPQVNAATYQLDGPTQGWFTSLDIDAIILGKKPVWEELKEVVAAQ